MTTPLTDEELDQLDALRGGGSVLHDLIGRALAEIRAHRTRAASPPDVGRLSEEEREAIGWASQHIDYTCILSMHEDAARVVAVLDRLLSEPARPSPEIVETARDMTGGAGTFGLSEAGHLRARVATLTAERDAARAEVERMRARPITEPSGERMTYTSAQLVSFAQMVVDVALGEVTRQAGGGSHVDEAANYARQYAESMARSLSRLAGCFEPDPVSNPAQGSEK